MTTARRLLGAVVSALLLAGCTSDSGGSSQQPEPRSSPSASATDASSEVAPASEADPSTASPVAPTPPPEGACYRLAFEQLTRPSNDEQPVPCSDRHDAQTVHVGRLDLVVQGHALAVDSTHAVRQMSTTCPRRMAGYLGGSREDVRLSRFEAVWFSPSLRQADRGAAWFRCDVVAVAARDRLFPLPPPHRLAGVLDRAAGAAYGLCGTAEPGTPDFARVICARRHTWRAVATLAIPGGDRYPGTTAVRRAGDERCRELVGDRSDDPLRFRYGWEWPTQDQWAAGQRYGYCWAPD